MFYIINRTKHAVDPKTPTMEWNSESWPPASILGDFVRAGDSLELVQLSTEEKTYCGVKFIRQTVYTYGEERISPTMVYLTAQEKAIDWLADKVCPTGLILPFPRCGKCYSKAEDNPSLQSVSDTGMCWECRTPKHDVIVPRPKKK